MSERIIEMYRTGQLSVTDVFVILARKVCNATWEPLAEALGLAELERFKHWLQDVVLPGCYYDAGMGELFSEDERNKLVEWLVRNEPTEGLSLPNLRRGIIARAIVGYSVKNISEIELFATIARHVDDPSWRDETQALPSESMQRFRSWVHDQVMYGNEASNCPSPAFSSSQKKHLIAWLENRVA